MHPPCKGQRCRMCPSYKGRGWGQRSLLGGEAQQICMCHQGPVSRWLNGCVSLSLGFEKDISKQTAKDGPVIFPVSAPRFLCPPREAQGGCAGAGAGLKRVPSGVKAPGKPTQGLDKPSGGFQAGWGAWQGLAAPGAGASAAGPAGLGSRGCAGEGSGASAALEAAEGQWKDRGDPGQDELQDRLCLKWGVQGWLWWLAGACAFYKGPSNTAFRRAADSRDGGVHENRPGSAAPSNPSTPAMAHLHGDTSICPQEPLGWPQDPSAVGGTLCQLSCPWPKLLEVASR